MSLSKKLILGTANFNTDYGILDNNLNKKNIKKVLVCAKKNKIKFLETSKDYKSFDFIPENLLNFFKFYKKIDASDNYFLYGDIKKKLQNYLFDKKINCYGVIIRNSSLLLKKKNSKLFYFLKKIKQQNKIKKIGITIYDTNNLKKLINNCEIDFIQLPYNLLNKSILKKTKKIIKKKNIEIHIRSIFLQGLLLKNKDQLPKALKKLKKYWFIIDNILKKKGIDRYSACLNSALSANVDKLVVGVDNQFQVEQLFKIKKIKNFHFPLFKIKEKKLIDPIYWLKLKK